VPRRHSSPKTPKSVGAGRRLRSSRRIIISRSRTKTRGKVAPIPDWAAPALQGLAYWLGAQHALGLAANISEGAIAWELIRQVFTHRLPDRYVEAEVFYRHIPEENSEPGLPVSDERADLVITKVSRPDRGTAFGEHDVEAIIEIKHSRSRKHLVWEDIDYLAAQRSRHPELRAFLIYASINERPPDFTNPTGAAITPRNRKTHAGNRYKVRRVCRATQQIPSKNKLARGHYAVLIEVAPPKAAAQNDASQPHR
jgi:hypothetical protein